MPRLAIYIDRPHLREQVREDAVMAGFDVVRAAPLQAMIDASEAGEPDDIHAGGVLLVDCPAPAAPSLAVLARHDLAARERGGQLIIATTLAGLEDLFGCLDQSNPQWLIDATATDLALALGRARLVRPAGRLRELADEDRRQLLRLTEEVGRLASRIDRLSGWPDHSGGGGVGRDADPTRLAAPAIAFRGPPQEFGALPLRAAPDPVVVRRILRQRQQRGQFFEADLFADPAWDMLLDLTAARAERKRVAVTSLCIAAAVPATTALRWIAQMTEAGLFVRREDPADRRRAFIALSDRAAEAMTAYFAAIGSDTSGLT